MKNSMFLAVLRLIFALKLKIAPPNEIGVRVGEDREMMLTSRSGCHEDLFSFFLRSLDFGQKNVLNFGEDLVFFVFLFFFEIIYFSLNNCLNPIQD